ncbi:MAG: COX15/CtaA family protein [Candidatus Marinimicrobia bacterium]|nr:COX15/CtaA family protein [Candidatus Neomarinimicrobiota bacterium]
MNKYIVGWLTSACVLIISMVIIGGITRLTHSGLSMVKWKPVTGIVPPLSFEEWETEFELYKKFPEYQKINYSMTLNEFKSIYFWEYIHRVIGRILGILFIVPFMVFYYKKLIPPLLLKKLGVMFGLGLLQGFMGWFMVASGLVNNPHVSHYRLAIHFLLAIGLVGYIYWSILDYTQPDKVKSQRHVSKWIALGFILTGLIIVQMMWGAFTAGLKAGFAWNTFPKMNGEWIPPGLFLQMPWWRNFFENNLTVQFIHRSLGIIILLFSFAFWKTVRQQFNGIQKRVAFQLFLITLLQVILGIFTLILHIPVWLAVSHQLAAVILFLVSLRMNWIFLFSSQLDVE